MVLEDWVELGWVGLFSLIDDTLKWTPHLKYVNNKPRKTIYKFKELKVFFPHRAVKFKYTALVESIVYRIITYVSAHQSNL